MTEKKASVNANATFKAIADAAAALQDINNAKSIASAEQSENDFEKFIHRMADETQTINITNAVSSGIFAGVTTVTSTIKLKAIHNVLNDENKLITNIVDNHANNSSTIPVKKVIANARSTMQKEAVTTIATPFFVLAGATLALSFIFPPMFIVSSILAGIGTFTAWYQARSIGKKFDRITKQHGVEDKINHELITANNSEERKNKAQQLEDNRKITTRIRWLSGGNIAGKIVAITMQGIAYGIGIAIASLAMPIYSVLGIAGAAIQAFAYNINLNRWRKNPHTLINETLDDLQKNPAALETALYAYAKKIKATDGIVSEWVNNLSTLENMSEKIKTKPGESQEEMAARNNFLSFFMADCAINKVGVETRNKGMGISLSIAFVAGAVAMTLMFAFPPAGLALAGIIGVITGITAGVAVIGSLFTAFKQRRNKHRFGKLLQNTASINDNNHLTDKFKATFDESKLAKQAHAVKEKYQVADVAEDTHSITHRKNVPPQAVNDKMHIRPTSTFTANEYHNLLQTMAGNTPNIESWKFVDNNSSAVIKLCSKTDSNGIKYDAQVLCKHADNAPLPIANINRTSEGTTIFTFTQLLPADNELAMVVAAAVAVNRKQGKTTLSINNCISKEQLNKALTMAVLIRQHGMEPTLDHATLAAIDRLNPTNTNFKQNFMRQFHLNPSCDDHNDTGLGIIKP